MNNTPLKDRYQLEIDLLRLERQVDEVKAALRQAKFDLREAKAAEAEYQGSFRAFRDKLRGRREETETALRHEVQRAEADLAAAQREKAATEAAIPPLTEALAQLPPWESLRSAENETLWCRLEARYCAEVLIPLLEINHHLLMARRNQFNGTHAGEIKTRQDLAEIYTAPEAAGEACKPYVLRLRSALDSLEISFPVGTFFENPTAFLSEATQYTRMDRVNKAIDQVERLQQELPKLQAELS